MKPPQPDQEQKLDELADGLDAGWDTPEGAPVSLNPHSAPLPEELDELDADWDNAAPVKAPAKTPTPAVAASPARSSQARPNALRPSQARPNPTRAVTPAIAAGSAPVLMSKKDRREAERKRRAHEAQQKSAHKKQRKAERRAEAELASEQARLVEERAQAARQTREKEAAPAKRAKPKPTDAERAKRVPKRVRHEHSRTARASSSAIPSAPLDKSKPGPIAVPTESAGKKLIVPLLIALLVAVTLGFALSRAH